MNHQTDLKVSNEVTLVWGVCLGMRLIVQKMQIQASQWGIVSLSIVQIYFAVCNNMLHSLVLILDKLTIIVSKHINLNFPFDISFSIIIAQVNYRVMQVFIHPSYTDELDTANTSLNLTFYILPG